MSARDLTLDYRGFQDLVDEARGRVQRACPEIHWTEHNVSDPGITLIETFAWMTEMLVYRLNQMPSRLHLELLELLDIRLAPPVSAKVDLRFRLVGPAERSGVLIPAWSTEVTTSARSGEEPIVFRVIDDFTIRPIRPSACVLERSGSLDETPTGDDGIALPDRPAFSSPPAIGDAIYLGFEDPLDRLIVRVDVKATRAVGIGIDPDEPPLRWEVSKGGDWKRVEVLKDKTGGFSQRGGIVELQMPPETTLARFAGLDSKYWLRCVVSELARLGGKSPRYEAPPHLNSITAHAVGALVRADHAASEEEEELGVSDGTAGQSFTLRHTPAMDLRSGETLEVLEPGADEWVAWELHDSFTNSDREDPHFLFDAAAGEIQLGPSIRERERAWRQYGAVPPKGARLRMTRYRHGGGERGDVVANTLRRLRKPIAQVESVTNPVAAAGGVDAETPDAARKRAAMELRTQDRAVTAEDFEFLAGEAPVKISRARCLDPLPGETIHVHVLPPVVNPARPEPLTKADLTPRPGDLESVREFLDRKRLIGTRLDVLPMPLRAVTVVVDVSVHRSATADRVKSQILVELYRFLNPLVGGNVEGVGDGWDFGRPLSEGEVYALVQEVGGVDRVRMVRLYETDIANPDAPAAQVAVPRMVLEPSEVLCSGRHRVRAGRPRGD